MSSQNSAKPGKHGGCDPNLLKTTYANNIEQIREKRHCVEIPSIAEVFADRPKLLNYAADSRDPHIYPCYPAWPRVLEPKGLSER
jgi:hypothetical protein